MSKRSLVKNTAENQKAHSVHIGRVAQYIEYVQEEKKKKKQSAKR